MRPLIFCTALCLGLARAAAAQGAPPPEKISVDPSIRKVLVDWGRQVHKNPKKDHPLCLYGLLQGVGDSISKVVISHVAPNVLPEDCDGIGWAWHLSHDTTGTDPSFAPSVFFRQVPWVAIYFDAGSLKGDKLFWLDMVEPFFPGPNFFQPDVAWRRESRFKRTITSQP